MDGPLSTAILARGWPAVIGLPGLLRTFYKPICGLYLTFVCFGFFLFRSRRRNDGEQRREEWVEPRRQDEATKILALPLVRPPSPWGPF